MSASTSNALYHALAAVAKHQLTDLDWRGKSVSSLTPDETAAFAAWAFRNMDKLRQDRDGYLDRAITAEHQLVDTEAMREAAPAMLMVLIEVEEYLDDRLDIDQNGGPNEAMRLHTLVQAAIAKAKA